MAQYRYFHEGQLKVDPTTGTKCRTGQLNHQFVEQKFVGGVWIGIGDNDGVRYGDVAGAGCRFREGIRDGDYVVDVELEVAGFLLAEGDGWINIGGASGYNWARQVNQSNIVMEGHSFNAPWSNMDQILQYSVNKSAYYNSAVNGATVADCVTRAAVVDSKLIQETSYVKNILVLWIGTNELDNTAGKGLTCYNAMKAYVQARIAAGWKVFVYTMTPATASGRAVGFEAERVIFNNLIRSDLALLSKVYILDTDTVTELDDSTNVIYYLDLIHPSIEGAYLANQLFLNKLINLNAINLITPAETPINFILTPVGDGTGVATLDIFTSEPVAITLDGTGKFYDSIAGNTGETDHKIILFCDQYTAPPAGGVINRFFIKCPLGTSNVIISKNKITSIQAWTSVSPAPNLAGDLTQLTSLLKAHMLGSTTVSGDLALLTLAQYLFIDSANITVTNLTDLKNLCYFIMSWRGTLTVSIINRILADFRLNRDESKPLADRFIKMSDNGGWPAPSGQGVIDKAALQAYRSPNNDGANALWAVTTR